MPLSGGIIAIIIVSAAIFTAGVILLGLWLGGVIFQKPMTTTYKWRYETNEPCSKVCGTGVRARFITCTDGRGTVVDDSLCTAEPKPAPIEICNTQACIWNTPAAWSVCPSSCGVHTQTRTITCQSGTDIDCPSTMCTQEGQTGCKPNTSMTCGSANCTWMTSAAWDSIPCSNKAGGTCGYGTKTRAMPTCPSGVASDCINDPDSEAALTLSQTCGTNDCSWTYSTWTPASCPTCYSAIVGQTIQTRTITCGTGAGINESNCDPATKYNATQTCTGPACNWNSKYYEPVQWASIPNALMATFRHESIYSTPYALMLSITPEQQIKHTFSVTWSLTSWPNVTPPITLPTIPAFTAEYALINTTGTTLVPIFVSGTDPNGIVAWFLKGFSLNTQRTAFVWVNSTAPMPTTLPGTTINWASSSGLPYAWIILSPGGLLT